MISLKTAEDIAVMAENAKILRGILAELAKAALPGNTTARLNKLAMERMVERGARSAFLKYHGFPAALCASVNDEIVHGIPKEKVKLQEGDLLKLDLGLWREGFFADLAVTVEVGTLVAEKAKKLHQVTLKALWAGIQQAMVGNRTGDISAAIGEVVHGAGYHSPRGFGGHGIGRELHEMPGVPNDGEWGTGPRLVPGMVLCVEPMVMEDELYATGADGWTLQTLHGGLAAHEEEMVLITEEGGKLLRDYVQA